MSVAEIVPRGEEFERTPPHDLAAEQCVLGGMMLSKDAISDVLDVIKAHDYYRPAHQLVHDVILDLYGRGEPADAVTVAAELTRRGDIARVGGAPYLHTLIASVPTAANAGYYARIVRERAILRRLVEVGTRIVQLGYAGDGDADDLVDRAEAEIYGVTDRRVSEDYLALAEIMPGALDEIEAIGSRGGTLAGVPTGFADLDALTNGLHPGQMIVIAARPAIGKALALDTPLPTPTGWTTMGQVQVGDWLLGADGRPTQVVAASDVMTGRPCYEVIFDDGATVVADAEHGWPTDTHASRKSAQAAATGSNKQQRTFASVKTTKQIAATIRSASDGRLNHVVATARALDLPFADLPLPAYALGVWLGDGASAAARFTSADPEVALHVEADGMHAPKLSTPSTYALRFPDPRQPPPSCLLRELGVLGDKHIPLPYLRASEPQRRALLAGLLDTDGTVNRTGSVQFAVTCRRLAEDFRELVLSLGYRCGWSEKKVQGRRAGSSVAYTITFTTSDDVFRLERKKLIHKERRPAQTTPKTRRRYIRTVRPVRSVPVRCVRVDNADHLYLASRSMIPTHNSALALDICRAASVKSGLTSVLFSLEMSRNEITMRLLSAEARVPLHAMRTGQLGEDDWTRLARRMSEVVDAPLFIDDSPNMSMMEIRSKCRRLKQRNDLRLVVVDYLQLMSSPKRVENRQQEVSELSRSLKLLAKELQVPVVALAQLNRGPELRTDKRPLLADLRESGCLTASTRVVRADTNQEVALRDLLAAGERDIPVWSLDERLKYVKATMSNVFATGQKETYLLRLASGRQIEATGNHRFLSLDGWTPLAELPVGSRVGVPRLVLPPTNQAPWPEDRVVLLAHLLGDGSFVKNQPLRYASVDEASLAAVTAAARHFGVNAVRDYYPAARVISLRLPAPYRLARGRRNPIASWLDDLGLFGLRSHEKFVPDEIFRLPDDQVALFLRHLWATDGSVTIVRKQRGGRIYYASTSRRLLDDVAGLLRRFSINGRIRDVTPGPHRPQFTLDVSGREDQLTFLQRIGVYGARAEQCERLLSILASAATNPNVDTIPADVWGRVRAVLAEQKMSDRQFAAAIGTQFCGSTLWKHSPSRGRLAKVAALLDDADLELLATNDILWDEIVAVEPLGVLDVYDATVLGQHNFIADGIAVHNSIEQDSDVVILLHREDAYERESPR
ncbi:MAG: replicative DNA helicase, partial [Streptosporangiaceae bacterium]